MACRICHPELAPEESLRKGPGHFSVRFDDYQKLQALIEGNLLLGCYELIVEDSIAYCYTGIISHSCCDCQKEPCITILKGYNFSISNELSRSQHELYVDPKDRVRQHDNGLLYCACWKSNKE